MRKWAVITCVWVAILVPDAMASHIVGGEFELIHQEGFKYKLNLNLYFDVLNGNPGAAENSILVAVFRKKDNLRIGSVRLPLVSKSRVEYFQPDCSNGEVVTDKMQYSETINLPQEQFSDPDGYYVVWERCCRNYNITNVYSQDPAVGTYAGQAFYLEFPPVTKNGEPFINSSPILFPPLNDYACPYRPYWVDFQGTDPDGDSLVYSLATPLNTTTGEAVVPGGANPGPYPDVIWKQGFGLDDILHGAPDLEISPDGFLTVTPTVQGLFVFAVKVEEYRDSIKIGEVRRDFQLLVVDKCPEAEAPVIKGKKLTDAGFSYRENMSVTFPASTPDEERCIEVQITDPDAAKASDDYSESVYLQAIPLGFKEDVEGVLPENFEATLSHGSDATFQICFDECPYFKSGSFKIGIVAFDDACSLPLSDTLRIDVYVEPPPNNQAYFVDGSEINITVQEQKDGFLSRSIIARDDDNDNLSIDIEPVGFTPGYGISVIPGNSAPGEIEALLEWNYDCEEHAFDERTSFPFILTVDDEDQCQFADPVELDLNLFLELPPNTKPDINISVNPDNDNYHALQTEINSAINFNVTATDEDKDVITLKGEGINFDFFTNDITFSEKEGNGMPGLQSAFSWNIPCSFDISENDSLRMHFYTEDFDRCQIQNQDTIVVDVKLLPPPSIKPTINAFALEQTTLENNAVDVFVGQKISLRLVGADPDIDNVTLSLLNPEDLPGTEFPEKTSKGQVNSNFSWTPGCDIFQEDQDSVTVPGMFRVMDDNCYLAKGDTLEMTFTVIDTDNKEEQFRPPNVITPNNDQHNEYFELANIFDGSTGEERSMPEDNCAGKFQHIEIYNRWGRNVFVSQERQFKWAPDNEPPGVYYYYLKYSNKTYKGVISVIF